MSTLVPDGTAVPAPAALDPTELAATAATIAAVQLPDGLIPWFEGGHGDPWNHVEAAMALTVAGRRAEAEAAYAWLARTQRRDGAWPSYSSATGVTDRTLDANVCAYVATGTWHHWRTHADPAHLAAMWPVVERAVGFVLGLQTPRGEIRWARHADGRPWPYALLTGSSSICLSLACAVELAEAVGRPRPDWARARARLAAVVAHHPEAFEPKDRWAMDWYYPVLAGVLGGEEARARLARGAADFVMDGLGVRCVVDQPWVTAAETAECALAHLRAGRADVAADLLACTRAHRRTDGSYWTGIVHPDGVLFPADEASTYTAAAVVLASEALAGGEATAALFASAALQHP